MTEGIKGFVQRMGAPFTAFLVISLFVSALANWFLKTPEPFALGVDSLARPWSFLTYPWAFNPFAGSLSLICYLLLLFWLYSVGPGLEREMGTSRFAGFWVFFTVLPALLMWLGAQTMGRNAFLFEGGPFLPEAAVTVAWCFRNMHQRIMLYGVLPVPAPWLAALTAFATLMLHGSPNPMIGLLATAPLALAMLFAQNKLPIPFAARYAGSAGGFGGFGTAKKKGPVHATRAQAQYDEAYYDDVLRRERERDERERLRKLFESSLNDDK
ncbi:MAG: hypothetical protein ACO1SV_04545 [Fimbriimonas sp.]